MAQAGIEKILVGLDEVPELVREVVKEEYQPIGRDPETFDELWCSARGKMAMDDAAGSVADAVKAVSGFEITFKKALEVYVWATILSANEDAKERIGGLLKEKYPTFEFDPVREE
jgi:hypothetical protein